MDNIWETIPFAKDYKINSIGKVFSLKTNKIMKTKIDRYGYEVIGLINNKGRKIHPTIHRLVAICFIPNPDNKPQVNHINGNKLCNDASNLEWVSVGENNIHAIKNNLRYTNQDVFITDITTGNTMKFYSLKDAARFLNVAPSCIMAYIKYSYKYPFKDKYVIKYNIDYHKDKILDAHKFKKMMFVYDYLTKQWYEFHSITTLIYELGFNPANYRTKSLLNLGYIITSNKTIDIPKLPIPEFRIKRNRVNVISTPYVDPHDGYLAYNYLTGKEHYFKSLLECANFINKTYPEGKIITVSAVSTCASYFPKRKGLTKGFGVQFANNKVLPWGQKPYEKVLNSIYGGCSYGKWYELVINNEKFEINGVTLLIKKLRSLGFSVSHRYGVKSETFDKHIPELLKVLPKNTKITRLNHLVP